VLQVLQVLHLVLQVLQGITSITRYYSNNYSGRVRVLQGVIPPSVLPFFIYEDDFEVNNPLGSHKGI